MQSLVESWKNGGAKFVCEECQCDCTPIRYKSGIGYNEYQGSVSHDGSTEIISDCCEAPVIDADTLEYVADVC